MPVIRTDLPAVVIDCRDHGESDKIVTFFCRQTGRLSGIAKGAHRSKKRFVNKLELFSFLEISYSRSTPGSLAVITEAELLNSFITLRSHLGRYQAGSILREFIVLATSEQLPDDDLFRLILWGLHALDHGMDPPTVIILFLIKLYDCIGYRPDFSRCVSCGVPYRFQSPAVFNIGHGGLACSGCLAGRDYPGRPLSPGTIQLMVAAQQQPLETLKRLKITAAILREAPDCLFRYGRHLFQRDINSWKMVFPGAAGSASHLSR